MKTLKFMLAAATAIGLASASQAGLYEGATDFESMDLGAVDVSASSLFQYAGATAADNESEIVAGTPSGVTRPKAYRNAATGEQVLKVSTGTDPLLRRLQTGAGEDLTTRPVYIDTLVQFTVTPATDNVTSNGVSDKLMIYLKEDLTEGSEATNLMVKAALLTPADYITSLEDTFTEEDVTIGNVSVVPNTWYRLVVKSYADANGVVLFNVWLNDTKLVGDKVLYGSTSDVFPSLLGKSSTTLEAVGFAGEGLVDDLAMTTIDPYATSYDFTLTLGANVSSVSFTIGSNPQDTLAYAASPKHFDVYPGDVITIDQVVYATGYEAGATNVTGFASEASPAYTVGAANVTIELLAAQSATGIDFTLTLGQGVSSVSFTVDNTPYEVTTTTNITLAAGTVNYTATFDTANWWTGTNGSFTVAAAPGNAYTVEATRDNAEGVITSETTAADLGITGGAFASSTQAELTKVVTWAIANGKETSDVSAMTFETPLSPTADEKSYLLGTGTAAAVTETDAVAALEIASIEYDETNGWVIKSKGVNGQGDAEAGDALANGKIAIFGAATVNGEYTVGQSGKNFFKAVLVK